MDIIPVFLDSYLRHFERDKKHRFLIVGRELEAVLPSPTFVRCPVAQNVVYHSYKMNTLRTMIAIVTKI